MKTNFKTQNKFAHSSLIKTALFSVSVLALTGGAANALVINPFFDSSVTSSEQQVIEGAISSYENMFSNPETVSIEFMTSSAGGGTNQASDYVAPYSTYTNWLGINAINSGDSYAVEAYNNLKYGNTAQQVLFTSADGRALGCTNCVGGVAAQGSISSSTMVDGIVTVGSSYYGNGAQVVYHEIDEVLGIGGQGSVLQASMPIPPPLINNETTIGTMDLYRYSAPQTPSLTNSTSAYSYFSLNGGATQIVAFNQSGVGDYGDWASGQGCYIQTYETCSNPTPLSVTSPEGMALQAVGYDAIVPAQNVPEPGSFYSLLAGAALLGIIRVKSKTRYSQKA